MTAAALEPGSFRDPSGRVYEVGGRIFRTVTARAADDYAFLRDAGLLRLFHEQGWLVGWEQVDRSLLGADAAHARYVIEHPRLSFISYPYEWSFGLLKAAALFHLDFHLQALECDVTLSDASAYNIQFQGVRPVFIDLLSLRRYREGEFWTGHRQFCEQFLYPLLLRAILGVAHNAWYRGSLEGITAQDLTRLLPLRRKLSWNALSQVVLPAKLQRSAVGCELSELTRIKQRTLPRAAFRAMLTQLRGWIGRLCPRDRVKTEWTDYETTHTYTSAEAAMKRRLIAEFASHSRPALAWDLGCNTGEYSEAMLQGGAGQVIGFDLDQSAVERAFLRARSKNLNFLPLILDAANPSPAQGWKELERKGLHTRARADALVALAFEHHLAIGRNIPLDDVVDELTALAPRGVIEFVQKSDPTVQRMLALREDVFPDYSEDAFKTALQRRARIVRAETASATGRRLFWFERA